MRVALLSLLAVVSAAACASSQHGTTTVDPAVRSQAIEDVTQIVTANCEDGLHGPLAQIASDRQLLIRGTAGETMEGRAALEETNASYQDREVEVAHRCAEVHRRVYASASGDVVWVEEGLRTHVAWPPSFSVEFPSQRTMVFEREGGEWRLQYYALSVALSDDNLDEAFAASEELPPAPDSVPAAAAPATE
jgi:hypothetical protein